VSNDRASCGPSCRGYCLWDSCNILMRRTTLNDTEKRDAISLLQQVGATVNVSLIYSYDEDETRALSKIERLLNSLISRVGEL
jgi:hypothetical protein